MNHVFRPHLVYFLVALVALAPSGTALAVGDAYFPQDTTLTLDGTNYTIIQSSHADQILASGDTLTLTMSAGQSFTLASSDKRIMSNNGGHSYSCSSTESRITITISSGSSQQTITVTPKGDCTTPQTSSGGGGGVATTGGGAGAASTPTPTPATTTTPAPGGRTTPEDHNLAEGDTVSAQGSNDPDIYIVNEHGFKRLFLNPVIFDFYGHLGGFNNVKKITSSTRDAFEVSGLFRNCETDDTKVYGVEVTGEDTGTLHHVNLTGDQAVAQDAEFFKKVFCINNNEFNWYTKNGTVFGSPYSALSQIPPYRRQ